jgi:hypothetical protein
LLTARYSSKQIKKKEKENKSDDDNGLWLNGFGRVNEFMISVCLMKALPAGKFTR